MIRQAQTYLAGALSGTALIGAAVVAFVLLVSLGALRDWPLAEIGGGDDDAAVSDGRAAPSPGTAAQGGVAAGAPSSRADRSQPRRTGSGARQDVVGSPGVPVAPVAQAPGGTPVSSQPGSAPGTASQPSSASAGGGGGSGGGSQPSGSGAGSGSSQSPSGAVTGAVNETVSGVDKATGGALGETGVTTVTETAVNGVAGPESTVGKTVDKVTETVGGLLGGKR